MVAAWPCEVVDIGPRLPLLDHDPVDVALGGLLSGEPVCEFDREADRPSKDGVNRTRLLRLYEEGACDDEEVRWARKTQVTKKS